MLLTLFHKGKEKGDGKGEARSEGPQGGQEDGAVREISTQSHRIASFIVQCQIPGADA